VTKNKKIRRPRKIESNVNPTHFFNRELSWLEFNSRVLNEAKDPRTPLLERLRFLTIYTNNLDEFVMKRIGGLKRQVISIYNFKSIDGLTPQEQLAQIRTKILADNKEQEKVYQQIKKELALKEIFLLDWKDLSKSEVTKTRKYFLENIFPILTPLSVDPGRPFPFISNLSYSLGVMLENPESRETTFSRIKIPRSLSGWLRFKLTNGYHFVKVEDVIINNLNFLYPEMKILKVMPFKITRNADIQYDDEDAEDLLEMIEEGIKERKFQEAIRLDYVKGADKEMLSMLQESLELDDTDLYEHEETVDYLKFDSVINLDFPDLKYKPWNPITPKEFRDNDNIFSLLKEKDYLLHHPYESFSGSVERFLAQAAEDPNVLTIKMTLYRTGDESSFIDSLILAAEKGKQVVCLVELKARFDEEKNIFWANKLEESGVHVVYGIVGLKTHSKITMLVRKEANHKIQRYVHIGTGNYNAKTAKLYTDFGLFTCKQEIVEEVTEVFNYLTGSSLKKDYKTLLVAPINMKSTFITKIAEQVKFAKKGKKATIIAKMNQLEDTDISIALYAASQAGVKVILYVRGFCCLKPGVKDLSENIKVVSIVGRFLEHSRVFYFSNGEEDPVLGEFLIGSADWMHRNLHSRVEVITPISDPNLKRKMWDFFEVMANDKRRAWDLQNDGSYVQRRDNDSKGTHIEMIKYIKEKT
jgi:polyphosphate kinase